MDPSSHEGSSTNFEIVPAVDEEAAGPSRSRGDDSYVQIDNESEFEMDIMSKNSLYLAALTGNWNEGESLIQQNPGAIRVPLTDRNETALHIAVAAERTSFVKELVNKLEPDDLSLATSVGYTAISLAAISGTVKIAEVLVEKDPTLPFKFGYGGFLPLYLALTYKRRDMANYLFSLTLSRTDSWALQTNLQLDLLHATIFSDYYDLGLKILKKNPELALKRNRNNKTALHALARKSHAIGPRPQLRIWDKCIYFCFNGMYNKALMKTYGHEMVQFLWDYVRKRIPEPKKLLEFIETPSRFHHDAARVGNVEFLIILIRSYPDLIWNLDCEYKSIFHTAVEYRQEEVFKLIYEIGGLKNIIANFTGKDEINMLQLAANIGTPNQLKRVSGPALQMQRELQWFKEVENIVAPCFSVMMTKPSSSSSNTSEGVCSPPDGLTIRQIFTEQHKQLRKDGEEWMKTTSNSCMLVATLIATVVFAAAFTLPGGNFDDMGTPIFRHKNGFVVFVVADATALISSSISIMMFLSILTSRFAEEDFLNSLPWRLLIGLATLFISIACMDVAFGTTFFLFYDTFKATVPWVIAGMAFFPVVCFSILQHKLWTDTFQATFWSKYIFKPSRRKLIIMH